MHALPIKIHVGYESITDEDHEDSSHMRQRISGIIDKHFHDCKIIHLSAYTNESFRNCTRVKPAIAVLSIRLSSTDLFTLKHLISFLKKLGVKIVVLYKISEELPEDREILEMEAVTPIRVKQFQEDFGDFIATL